MTFFMTNSLRKSKRNLCIAALRASLASLGVDPKLYLNDTAVLLNAEERRGMMENSLLQELRVELVRRLEVLKEARSASADDRSVVPLDQTAVGRLSRMDAMQVQAMALASDRRREGEMARISAALERIDKGIYGACITCGDDMDPKRLMVDPTIQRCVDCMREV
jgi:DnaK suppressor protein